MYPRTPIDEKNDRFFFPSIEQELAEERAKYATLPRRVRKQARPQGDSKVEVDPEHDAEEGTEVPVLQPTIGNSPPHRAGGSPPRPLLDSE